VTEAGGDPLTTGLTTKQHRVPPVVVVSAGPPESADELGLRHRAPALDLRSCGLTHEVVLGPTGERAGTEPVEHEPVEPEDEPDDCAIVTEERVRSAAAVAAARVFNIMMCISSKRIGRV